MILYDYAGSGNGYKVRLLMHHLGVGYRYEPVDIMQGEAQAKSFVAKNSFAKIPLLETSDGFFIRESNAILMHLARNTDFLPHDSLLQTRILEWLFWEQYEHEPSVAVLRSWHIKGYLSDMDPDTVAAKRNDATRALRQIDDALDGQAWLVGDRFTIADICLFAYSHLAEEASISLDNFSNLRDWCNRIEGLPGHVGISDSAQTYIP